MEVQWLSLSNMTGRDGGSGTRIPQVRVVPSHCNGRLRTSESDIIPGQLFRGFLSWAQRPNGAKTKLSTRINGWARPEEYADQSPIPSLSWQGGLISDGVSWVIALPLFSPVVTLEKQPPCIWDLRGSELSDGTIYATEGQTRSWSTKQTLLRDAIAEAMRDEMLICSLDDFLEKLAPFSPNDRWVDCAYDVLKHKKLLGTPAETAPSPKPAKRRRTETSKRPAAVEAMEAMARQEVLEPDEDVDAVQWAAYRNAPPGSVDAPEQMVFKPLEEIVNAIFDCPDPDNLRNTTEYRYEDCPGRGTTSEILGANFRVDAVITNPDVYRVGSESSMLAQAAVVMEFKKRATDAHENRKQLVSAANHIMNEDSRRNWTYGITIENTNMSLWYFSRSYSMMSKPFDFTKDFKSFIRAFLFFLYATEEELGYDPSISRIFYKTKRCYVYKLETDQGVKYYRTTAPLYNSRSCCITGRKSLVWKVVEVDASGLVPISGGREVALKDCWVDEGSLSEKEIQDEIFKQFSDIKEAAYAWAPPRLREKLKAGLAGPERYFMKIALDWKGQVNKKMPKCSFAPDLLAYSAERGTASGNVIGSLQTPRPSLHSSSNTSYSLGPGSTTGQATAKNRDYRAKQRYRVVYAHVGKSLAYATDLADAITAFEDIFIALTLLFLARWMHRDVSEGNIILVRNGQGVEAKLSDLEYARDFDQRFRPTSTDPKTGTPYFMPLEIHSGGFLFIKAPPFPSSSRKRSTQSQRLMLQSPDLRYNFTHDLESLWWIMVWVIFRRIKGSYLLAKGVFTLERSPSQARRDLFTRGASLESYFESVILDALRDYQTPTFLAHFNNAICHFYGNSDVYDMKAYGAVYEYLWEEVEVWIQSMQNIHMELEAPKKHGHADFLSTWERDEVSGQ